MRYCAGIPTVNYGSKTYHTVQIGNQCWFKENLDLGTRIDGVVYQADNLVLEKYCYQNDPANCDIYGGLYQWGEAMQYVTTEKAQGICPPGWHIPTQNDIDTLSEIVGDNGNLLKAEGEGSGDGSGNNVSGFSALLAGHRYYAGGYFAYLGQAGSFWSSTEFTNIYSRSGQLYDYNNSFIVGSNNKDYGYSVRCLKD